MPNITVDTGTRHDLTDDEILYKDSTDYHGSLVMENGHPAMYLFDGGYCSLWDNVSKAAETSFHYYTKDHLGNTREVMDESGTLEQVTNYYPFGTPYSDHTATGVSVQKYKYNGKELDLTHGLNTYDYGARQYYSVLLRWDRMDQLCESYYHVSPYVYCLNNPVNAVDPDGRKIVFAQNSSDEFKLAFNQVARYLINNGCGEFIKALSEVVDTYIIKEGNSNAFSCSSRIVEWNPNLGLDTGYTVLSPATLLNHELDHAVEFQNNADVYLNNIKLNPDDSYHTTEEKRVITGSERRTAEALGEIEEGDITRDGHHGIHIKTESPISNKPLEELFNVVVTPQNK